MSVDILIIIHIYIFFVFVFYVGKMLFFFVNTKKISLILFSLCIPSPYISSCTNNYAGHIMEQKKISNHIIPVCRSFIFIIITEKDSFLLEQKNIHHLRAHNKK